MYGEINTDKNTLNYCPHPLEFFVNCVLTEKKYKNSQLDDVNQNKQNSSNKNQFGQSNLRMKFINATQSNQISQDLQHNLLLHYFNDSSSSSSLKIQESQVKRNFLPAKVNLIPTSDDISLQDDLCDSKLETRQSSQNEVFKHKRRRQFHKNNISNSNSSCLNASIMKTQNNSYEQKGNVSQEEQQSCMLPVLKSQNNSASDRHDALFGARKNSQVKGKLSGRLIWQINDIRNALRENTTKNEQNFPSSGSKRVKLDSLKQLISSKVCFFSSALNQVTSNTQNESIIAKLASESLNQISKREAENLVIQSKNNNSSFLINQQSIKRKLISQFLDEANFKRKASVEGHQCIQVIKERELTLKSTENRNMILPLKQKRQINRRSFPETELRERVFQERRNLEPNDKISNQTFEIGEKAKSTRSSYFMSGLKNREEFNEDNKSIFTQMNTSQANQFLKNIISNKSKQFVPSDKSACSPIKIEYSKAYSFFSEQHQNTLDEQKVDPNQNEFQPWQSDEEHGIIEIMNEDESFQNHQI